MKKNDGKFSIVLHVDGDIKMQISDFNAFRYNIYNIDIRKKKNKTITTRYRKCKITSAMQ